MGSTFSVIKVHCLLFREARVALKRPANSHRSQTLIVPAVISLILFLTTTFVLVPLWQRYRNRYSQYLPLDTISTQTLSLRSRIQEALVRFLAPSAWRARVADRIAVAERGSFDSEEGEELGDVDEPLSRRVLDRERGIPIDSQRRLSRELVSKL